MPRRALALALKDLRVSLRDQVATYTLVGGIALAAMARAFLPFVEAVEITAAVAVDVDRSISDDLDESGVALRLPDRAAVVDRVFEIDDVPGVARRDDGSVEVILEGNEHPAVVEAVTAVVDAAIARGHGERIDVEIRSLGRTRTPLRALLLALAIYSSVVLSGTAIGLTMVDESEGGTIEALRVTPIRLREYLAAKLLGIAGLALVTGALAGAVALGADAPLGRILAATAVTVPIAWLFGLTIGALARTQLGAFSVIKALLLAFISLPVLGFIDLGDYAWALVPFAPHWGVQTMHAALTGAPMGTPALAALVSAAPPLGVVLAILARRVALDSRR